MEVEVNERLKLAEMKKDKMKQSIHAFSTQSASFLEVSVKWNVFDEFYDSMVKLIEKKRDEAVSEIRVRENEVKRMVEEIRVMEERFEGRRRRDLGEMRERETELREWERKAEKRIDDLRSKNLEEMRKKEKELKEWEKRVKEMEDRVGILRSGIFGEIHKERLVLKEKEMRRMRVEELEREVEERAMQMEGERTRLAKKFDGMLKAMECRETLNSAKVKELDTRKGEIEEEKIAVRRRGEKLEMKEKEIEKEHCRIERALKVMVHDLEKESDQNKVLREKVSLLTQKIAYGQSPPSKLFQDLDCANNISPRGSTPYEENSELANTMNSNIAIADSLISDNKRVEALKYICESNLEDVFTISSIVDIHINYLKQNSRKILEERRETANVQEAVEFEIAGLNDLINCIEAHALQDRYSPAILREQIAQLRTQFYTMNRAAPSLNPIPRTSHQPLKKARLHVA